MSSDIEKLTRAIWSNSIFDNDLPVGIYTISKEGNLITCNQRARDILKLPQGYPNHNIQEFCSTLGIIEQMSKELKKAESENRWIEKQILSFKVEGREVFVHHYMRAIKDDITGETFGYLCCMVDCTEEERYRQMFESLPVGAYQVDENDRLIKVNHAFARMLGYESASEVENRSVKELYLHPEDASKFRQLVEEQDAIVSQRVELLRKDNNEIIVASVIARKIRSLDGKYMGREGAMTDVTTEERYRMLLEEMPLGLYEVRIDDQGEAIIRHCNNQFAAINQFDDVKDVKGFKVKDFYSSAEEYKDLVNQVQENAKEDKPLHGRWVSARGQKGKDMVIEVNTRALIGRNGKIIGRVGAVREVTEEARLKDKAAELRAKEEEASKKVQELTSDIGNVLHSYSTSLVNVRQSANVVLRSLGPDPFERAQGLKPEEMVDFLNEPAKQFAESVGKLLQADDSQGRSQVLPEDQRNELSKHLSLLRDYEKIIPYPMAHPSTLRESAVEVLSICNDIQKGMFARELLRQIRTDAQELVRICNLITLHQVSDLMLEMDHVVRQLRAYVISDRREKDAKANSLVRDLVSQTTTGLYEFARSRGISFKIKHDNPDCRVDAVSREVVRALSNLLHNAIKYSWKRLGGTTSWILIHTHVVQGMVHIEFENYGVPIPKEEIDQGLIFRIGWRGRKSSDRKRTGTGIGLADAFQIAGEHKGGLILESHPASPKGHDDDYTQPFLTTAIFMLPIHTK